MKALKKHIEEPTDFNIPENIQSIIDDIDIGSDWKTSWFWSQKFIYLDAFLRKHPLYSSFYIWNKSIDKKIKDDLTVLKKIQNMGFLKWIMSQSKTELWEKEFDESKIGRLIYLKFKSGWIFVDDFIIVSLEKKSLHNFITVLLLCQLKSNPINVTDFVNTHYLTDKLVIHSYEGFEDYYWNLNWVSVNSSTDVNMRLAAIVLYNLYVSQLWLNWIMQTVKYIHSSKIDFHKRVFDWKEMDDVMSSHYVIDKTEFKTIITESFDIAMNSANVIEVMWRLNGAPWIAWYYLISQYDFNNIFDAFGEKFRAKILGYFNSKTAKQMFQDRIKQIMDDAKQWKFMNRRPSGLVDY